MSKAKKAKKPFTFTPAINAAAVLLFLVFLLVLISPRTHLYGLAYGMVFLVGPFGFYLLFLFMDFLSASILFRSRMSVSRLRIFGGFLLLLLGVCILFGKGALDKAAPADFVPTIEATGASLGKGLYTTPSLYGGIIGINLASIFKTNVGDWLVLLVGILLVAGGALVISLPYLISLIRNGVQGARKASEERAKARDRAEKEAALAAMAKEKKEAAAPYIAPEDIDNSFFEGKEKDAKEWNSPLNRFSFTPAGSTPVPSSSSIAETRANANNPSPSPYGYGAREASVPTPIDSSGPITPLGLQEARFDFFDEKKQEDASMLRAESLPKREEAVPYPAPSPSYPAPPVQESTPAPQEPLPFENKEEEAFDFDSFAPRLSANQEARLDPSSVASEPLPAPEEEPYEEEAPYEEETPDYAVPPVAPIIEPQPIPTPIPTPAPAQAYVAPAPSPAPAPVEKKPYVLPGTDLLEVYEETVDLEEINRVCAERAAAIDQKFRDLGVGAHVSSFTSGPSVTRYDIETDPNVSVNSISRFIKDISQAMGGVATRFTEIVPGHTTSALEVVNENSARRMVPFSECFNGLPPIGPKTNMAIPFGVDIENNVIWGDLSSFPHMLVAGTTGSGKSIFIQGILMSLVMRNRPEEVKLVLVDPKRVEFAKYRDIPHLLCPIIKEAHDAKVALRKLCEEMDRRYKMFEDAAVSNIREYNNDYCEINGTEKLSFIVLVIDEYADLMEQEKDVASSVLRLSQKARACGIHMLVCTQRPDTKVITGTIKNNLSTRVALHLKTVFDSSTILNEPGAEELADHGDMIVDCDKVSRHFLRLQGCMVQNREIMRVTDFVKKQQAVVYHPYFSDFSDPEAEKEAAAAKASGGNGAAAPTNVNLKEDSFETVYLYVRDAIMSMDATSISRIQRDFRVGYPRASEIFNKLIEDGIVAPKTDAPNSSRPCQVLVHSLEELNGEAPKESGPGSFSQSYTTPAGVDDYE